MRTPILRFAPSPNGYLHLGHALSALMGYETARSQGGRFLVRIEDIDLARTREACVSAILEDLAWLGLTWSEPVLRQSSRFAAYREAAGQLADMGVLYPCFATRAEIAAAASRSSLHAKDPDGTPLYPGLYRGRNPTEMARRRAAGEAAAMRLDMARALHLAAAKLGGKPLGFTERAPDGSIRRVVARPERWGDAIIQRKDTPTSYHLSVVVDDAFQGVTLVTRGTDLLAATDIHRLLQVLLDLPEPTYAHHRLLLDTHGRKLSKSDGAKSLATLRSEGWTPADIRRSVGLGDKSLIA
ncbi:MAG: tRNA glutamyl-Q(34) synthetase GluQRS [Hyphomicrobiaceae bacterium]|nr:tRNA glutamyl-Q(34) synthetase GluQRS [Hyphomicrobiaceae bacterium]